jgi:hypothetical protein
MGSYKKKKISIVWIITQYNVSKDDKITKTYKDIYIGLAKILTQIILKSYIFYFN